MSNDWPLAMRARLVKRRGRVLIRLERVDAPCVRKWETRQRQRRRHRS
jgi:hypothetical protein